MLLATLALFPLTGCVVTQPSGAGKLTREVEPTTSRGYWRYLPKGYLAADEAARQSRRWPIVVSFHGMKPFDNAHPQALEWEFEADRYGYIVIAPELRAPDMLAEFPVKSISTAFRSDEDASVAIVRHVCQTTGADCSNVLATSWSSGGYLAHYMFNRHPEVFTAIAVRQSNFSVHVLDPAITVRSRDNPILIVNTENDFAVCKEESAEAIQWYERNGYRKLAWLEVKSLGHERTPDMAADFFAKVVGITPESRPTVLVERQAINGNARGLAILGGQAVPAADTTYAARGSTHFKPTPTAPTSANRATPPRVAGANAIPRPVASAPPRTSYPPAASSLPPVQTNRVPASSQMLASSAPRPDYQPPTTGGYVSQAAPSATTVFTGNASPAAPRPTMPQVGIQVTSAIGTDPLLLGFSAECPADWYRTADFIWTLNGNAIGNGSSGQRTIDMPGEYQLGLLIVTDDGVEHRANRLIRVIPRVEQTTASRAPYTTTYTP